MMATRLRLWQLHTVILIVGTMAASSAWGKISFTGSYSNSSSSFGLQSYQAQGGSIAVSLGLGTFVGIRLMHRQEFRYTDGYKVNEEDDSQFKTFESRDHITTNAIDLKFILYPGQVLVPYLTAGYGLKTYKTVATSSQSYSTINLLDDVPQETESLNETIPSPVGGIGLAIRINREFSLDLSHNLSLGYTSVPEGETTMVLDSYNNVGITYRLL